MGPGSGSGSGRRNRARDQHHEGHVTAGGQTYKLPAPFFVLATQNPIEQEGTDPLPEEQQDRFMFNIRVEYPTEADEYRILEATTSPTKAKVEQVVDAADLLAMQKLVLQIPAAPFVIRYAGKLVRATRPLPQDGETPSIPVPDFVKKYVSWGAGPRAVQYLILGAKARAALLGSYMVRLEDIQEVAAPVLTHRIITTFAAQAEGIDAKKIVRRLVDETNAEA